MKILKCKQVWHPWQEWECYRAGFYETQCSIAEPEKHYRQHFTSGKFAANVGQVFIRWPLSSEHFLTNPAINRIAWLGQASVFCETGVPKAFAASYKELPIMEQEVNDRIAVNAINAWISSRPDLQVRNAVDEPRLF